MMRQEQARASKSWKSWNNSEILSLATKFINISLSHASCSSLFPSMVKFYFLRKNSPRYCEQTENLSEDADGKMSKDNFTARFSYNERNNAVYWKIFHLVKYARHPKGLLEKASIAMAIHLLIAGGI